MDFLNKTNRLLFFLIAIYLLFYHLAGFLIPITFGIFLTMLILPFTRFLEKYKFNSILSSLTSTFVLFLFLGVLSYLFIFQISQLADQLPGMRGNIEEVIENLEEQIAAATGLTIEEQQERIEERIRALWGDIETRIAGFIGGVLEFTLKFLLVFVYVFIFLLYRKKFMRFIVKLYSTKKEKENARNVVNEITKVVYQYLWGRAQVMLSLAVMYYITFLIFGLPFALLITIFGALITIIPYFGPLVSGLVPISFAIIFFEDISYIVIFSITIIVIQLVESYFFEPYFIGKEVKLNALAVIIAVLLGGIIWGIAGMILFVPILATIKIISNHSKDLRPFGALLGK